MGNICNTNKNRLPIIFTTNLSNIKRYSHAGKYRYCKFDQIYDGDTADIYFYDNSTIIRFAFRFYGYDSAEMKPLKSDPNREQIKKAAKEDKLALENLLKDKYLVVHFMENEKYGRMMGNVWIVNDTNISEDQLENHPDLIDDNCINKIMLRGHGKVYYGGKK